MSHSHLSDQELLRATAAGDAEAYGEFFRRHANAMLAFTRRRLNSAEQAADLTAETFAAALLSVHRGHAKDVPNGRAWLVGIARNKLIDTYRCARIADSARGRLDLPRIAVDDEALERIDRLTGDEALASAALEELAPNEREAIIERIVCERDYEDIALALGESPTTVRKRVSRGLMRLREEIGGQH